MAKFYRAAVECNMCLVDVLSMKALKDSWIEPRFAPLRQTRTEAQADLSDLIRDGFFFNGRIQEIEIEDATPSDRPGCSR